MRATKAYISLENIVFNLKNIKKRVGNSRKIGRGDDEEKGRAGEREERGWE